MFQNTLDLSLLNDAELQVLRLFAQGHTAKSVAQLTDRSVGAVNERLREARRKTGVTSSRELARLLVAQENWDEKLALDQEPSPVPAVDLHGKTRREHRLLKGSTMMILLAISLLSASTPSPSGAVVEKDEILSSLMPQDASPLEQYQQVRGEARDESWAHAQEQMLGARFAVLLAKYGVREQVRVMCARTLCEVALRAKIGGKRQDGLVAELQERPLFDDLKKYGLTGTSAGFGSDKETADMLYFSYWKRS